MQVMKVGAPPLLPILRSGSQARLLTAILLDPEREFTLNELADAIGVSVSTVTREVQRAEQAGIVITRQLGRAKLARADTTSLLNEPLTDLLLVSFGPAPVAAGELRDVEGIDEAYIFGSWAARYLGEPGPYPRDVDVIVIGEPDRDVLYVAADRMERRLGRPVQVTTRSREQWDHPNRDSFIQEVQSRPLVALEIAEREAS